MNAANKLVSQILDDFGIRVIRARSSNEARERINDNDRYDLILTSSRHNTEPSGPLRFCEVQYFEVPGDAVPQYGTDPESFSRSVNANAPGGFVFIDQLKQQEIEKENSGTEASMLPVIFFSASSGGISGNICARAVTNRGCPAAKRDQRARRKALV
jgi:CheY-like chemotaxis protein